MNETSDYHKPKSLFPLLLVCFVVCLVLVWHFGAIPFRPVVERQISKGAPEPQYQLGRCCYYGCGVDRNYVDAAKWFRAAAGQGHSKAQMMLGLMYAEGIGVPQDSVEAIRLIRQAADTGLPAAQNQLGKMYAQGKGVPQDLDEAASWFARAANAGSSAAAKNLKLLSATRPAFLASLTLRTGPSYRSVKVQKVEPDSMTISFQPCPEGVGVAKIAFNKLPDSLQTKYGYVPGAKVQKQWEQLTALVSHDL